MWRSIFEYMWAVIGLKAIAGYELWACQCKWASYTAVSDHCRLYSVECVCGQKKVYRGLTMAKGAFRGTDQCACESLSCLSLCFRPQLTGLFQNMFFFHNYLLDIFCLIEATKVIWHRCLLYGVATLLPNSQSRTYSGFSRITELITFMNQFFVVNQKQKHN